MEKKKIEEFFGQIADRTTSTSSTLLRVKEEELAREADAAWQAAAVLSDLAEALEEESERGLEKGHEKQEKEEKEKDGKEKASASETNYESTERPESQDPPGSLVGYSVEASPTSYKSVSNSICVAVDPRKPMASANPVEPKAARRTAAKAGATGARVEKSPTKRKNSAVSKASVKDLRTKLQKTREEELSPLRRHRDDGRRERENTKEKPEKEKDVKDEKEKKMEVKKATASEELRAKLLEAKQRIAKKDQSREVLKDKKDKKEKKEKKRETWQFQHFLRSSWEGIQPMPKQQALPLLCREEKKQERETEEKNLETKIAEAKARRLEELREREAQKVQQVHSKAAARKKKEVEDSVRELARKLSQDILEISEIINVESIKEENVKREGRVGHFGGNPVKSEMVNTASTTSTTSTATSTASTSGLFGVKSESAPSTASATASESAALRALVISPEIYAQQMSQLTSMATPEATFFFTAVEAVALSCHSLGSSGERHTQLESESEKPTVCTIGWEPNVEAHVMIKLLEGYRIGSIIDARPPEFNCDGFGGACAAHGWTYDRQPVLSIHPYDLGPMGPVAFNTIGRIVSQARASVAAGSDGSCRRQCILFAGDQSWQEECNWHIVQRLRGCAIEVQQISLDRYWDEAAVFEEEAEKGGVIVAGPPLTQVVDELRSQVGLPKIGDERDRQLMVTARAGLETWVAKKFKQDLRLKSKVLGPEATLKERIDCLREACPELSRVVSMAHFLRMIGNNSAHTGGAAIPPRYQLVQLVQKLTFEIKEADEVAKAHSEADKKWETAEPFAAVLAKISGEAQSSPQAPVSARLQLQQSVILPQDGEHKATLVYLHPFGSGNVRYLQGKAAFAAKGLRIVLPLAPSIPVTAYKKRQCISWFDYYGDSLNPSSLEADPLSLEDVRVRISLTLEREATLLGENGHKRLLVGGLAQGGEAALHAALMHHQVVGGFVGVCTNLLPCTLPEGNGRMKLHFFGYDRDPKVWSTQTRDVLLPHHDLIEHGDIFGTTSFNLARIDFKLEAQCLHCACEAVLAEDSPEGEGEAENAAPVEGGEGGEELGEHGEQEMEEKEEEAEEAEEEEKEGEEGEETAGGDVVDPLLNEMAAAIGIDPEAVPLLDELSEEEIPGESLEANPEREGEDEGEGEGQKKEVEGAQRAPEAEEVVMSDGNQVSLVDSEPVVLMKATAKVLPSKRARTSYEQDGQRDLTEDDAQAEAPAQDKTEKST
ncbi:Acyl-protein thioesterase 1 (APT-1) (Lysophospholipase 1) (Lysophospholipase I) (LPL-I) (LysoPLA I) [Durusdinium trenchii]|uniref:Acyl-protein thioesterase 1 (APT-1) (Lysophospholipase 1) (Lysophospholipase I) (LPL-I) (LysoPLA I) n=1 Tax=Durusdinium trenchii TaxID=1381693 RepID=A0ABP0MT40_9DINO